ncbi:MAG: terminase [Mycobacterium sp.]|nr:MAG: terminase [Mycobacterium sp.]
MPAGPKKGVDDSPLPFLSNAVGVERFADFCSEFLVTPKGCGAGTPFRLRDWQIQMLRPVLDPSPRPSVAGIMCPRGTGKTALMAALGLYELFLGPDGNEIPIVAVDERQAGLTLRPAIRMVELNPALASRCHVYRDSIRIPGKGSTLTALPAEAKRLEGLGTWTLALADEVGVISHETWQTLLLGLGKLPGATAIGIGTPPNSSSSVLLDLRKYAMEHSQDRSFAWVEFSADEFQHHDAGCEHCWELACPSLDDFLTRESMHALLAQTTEGNFRRSRLCQVVSENTNPFIPADVWEGLRGADSVPDGADVVIALDGSHGGRDSDATALVIGTVSPTPHFDVLAVWENVNGSPEYRIDVLAVEDAIRQARNRWNVKELVADPFRWTRSLQVLSAEGLRVTEFPWSPSRTTKATTDLHAAAMAAQFSHSGDETLTRHVMAATVIESNGGLRIGKTSRKRSAAKIDCAAALLMCHSRCQFLGTRKKKRTLSFR